MNSETITWIFIVYSVCVLENCYSLDYNGAKIVTYGEPCVTSRRLPFQIEVKNKLIINIYLLILQNKTF